MSFRELYTHFGSTFTYSIGDETHTIISGKEDSLKFDLPFKPEDNIQRIDIQLYRIVTYGQNNSETRIALATNVAENSTPKIAMLEWYDPNDGDKGNARVYHFLDNQPVWHYKNEEKKENPSVSNTPITTLAAKELLEAGRQFGLEKDIKTCLISMRGKRFTFHQTAYGSFSF